MVGPAQNVVANTSYTATSASSTAFALPATASVGDMVRVNGLGTGGWSLSNLAVWTPRDSNRQWRSMASSADGSKLVAAVDGEPIYISADSGATWAQRESHRNWQSVASSADGSKLVAVRVGGQIYTSADSGVTWTARESDRFWVSVASSADGSKLVAW